MEIKKTLKNPKSSTIKKNRKNYLIFSKIQNFFKYFFRPSVVTHGQTERGRTEILVSNIGFLSHMAK